MFCPHSSAGWEPGPARRTDAGCFQRRLFPEVATKATAVTGPIPGTRESRGRQCRVLGIQEPGESRGSLLDAPGKHHAQFRQKAPDLVHQGRPLLHQESPHRQEDGQFLLGHRLDRHEPHRGPGHGLADGFHIPPVVLVGFDVGLHVFGVHQPDRVHHLFELPAPVVRSSAGLHADGAGGKLRHRLQKPGPGYDLLEDCPAPFVHPVESENGFCDVDAQRRHLPLGPSSLDGNGTYDHIVAL